MGAEIKAIEYVFPSKEITNDNLRSEFPDYDFAKFESRVGIKSRFIVDHDQTALDLSVLACEKLFKKIDKHCIDFIIFCTQSPDYFLPTGACILQDRLGLSEGVGSFDYNLGCSGYTYGLSIVKGFIASNQASNVLLVTSETYSKYLHPEDRSNRAIFGDAATATLISKSEDERIGESLFGTNGEGYDKLIVKNGAARSNYDNTCILKEYGSGNKYTDNHLYMDGLEIFNFTNKVIPNFILNLLVKNSIEKTEIDQFILHQANAYMLGKIRHKLKVDEKDFFIDIEGGNTVSNTIPIALKRYLQSSVEKDRNILLVGFGVGLSWSGCLIKTKNKL